MIRLDLAYMLRSLENDAESKQKLIDSITRSSARLMPQEHHYRCPVFHAASSTCVFPYEACVEDDWNPPIPIDVQLCDEETGQTHL